MSDPMHDRSTPPPPQDDPPPRKSSSPLIWILLLIALIAFGWYYYNRQSARDTIGDITPPPATSDAMTPAASTPADDAAADAAATRKAEKRRAARPERARSREAALLEQPRPSYPPEAYRAGEEGTVVVLAQVDAQGNASDVKVVERSGSRLLDRAATNEVRRWKFRPAMENGKAVASAVRVPVDYKLDDER